MCQWEIRSSRGKQIFSWLHEKLVVSFDDMTNLSKPLREKLEEKCRITALKAETVQVSKIDGTSKFLFELYDGNLYRKCSYEISFMVILYVYLHRLAAVWDAVSVRPHLMAV